MTISKIKIKFLKNEEIIEKSSSWTKTGIIIGHKGKLKQKNKIKQIKTNRKKLFFKKLLFVHSGPNLPQ